MNTRITSRSAFTLLELLVVLAVIGTLLGIVASYATGAKARARSVECQKNLGDWTKGLNMMIDDSRTHAFPAVGSGSRDDESAWYNVLARYLEVKPLKDYAEGDKIPAPRAGVKSPYVCPEADNQSAPGELFSYSYNKYLTKNNKRFRVAMLKKPAELVAFVDAPTAAHSSATESDVLSDKTGSFRHSTRINIGFCDGHVGSFKKPQVLQGSDTPKEVNAFGILWDPWPEDGGGSDAGGSDAGYEGL